MNLTNDKLEQVMAIAAKNVVNIFTEDALKPVPDTELGEGHVEGYYAIAGFVSGYGDEVTKVARDSVPALVSAELSDILQLSVTENTAKLQALICDKVTEYTIEQPQLFDLGRIRATVGDSLQSLCYIANNFYKYVPKDAYDQVTEHPIAFTVQFTIVKRVPNVDGVCASIFIDLRYKPRMPDGETCPDPVELPLWQIISDMKQAE